MPGRIKAAVDYLKQKGYPKIVLLAHSQGSTMTAYSLSQKPRQVQAFIAIGMSDGIAGGPMDTLVQLKGIDSPMLDLYGSEDLKEVIDSASLRATSAAANADYSQQLIPGADHFFDGEEEALLGAANAWLDQRF